MSKARLVITALFVDHQTPAEVAARYGVHRAWVYKLKARYEAEGEAALEPRSRRPKTTPHRDPAGDGRAGAAAAQAADRRRPGRRRRHHRLAPEPPPPLGAVAGHDQPDPGPCRHRDPRPVEAAEVLLHPVRGRRSPTRPGSPTSPTTGSPAPTAVPAPTPRSSPGSTTTPATPCTSPRTPGSPPRSCWPPSGKPVTCTDTPHPRSPTTAWSTPSASPAGRGGRTALEAELRRLGITQKNSRPNHPTTCGKVERFQQTLKKWLRAQPDQPTTIAELQTLLDRFREEYNQRRPHRSLAHRSTPATAYAATPQSHPGQRQTTDTHDRVRQRQDRQGRHRHPARRRPPAPHRRRPNLRRNPRPPARPRPPRPRRRRRHRRTPPRAHHRPPPRLPAHRTTTRPTRNNH